MFGAFDIAPSVFYGAMVGGSLRNEAELRKLETDYWLFAVTLSIFTD
jgi:hypothetical protein